MADYDLGKARGRIVIDYDDKGASQAQEDFQAVEEQANKLVDVFHRLTEAFGSLSRDFTGHANRFSAAFGLMAGGAAVLLGLSRATGAFSGSVFKMRGVLGILGSLGLLLGGVPKSVEGFPKVIKQIVLLSSAITLFAKSTKLMDGVVRQIGKFIGSTAIIKKLTSAFPALHGMFSKITKFIPSLGTVGKTIDGWGKPIHKVAGLALTIGTLITVFRTGTKAALALTKGVMTLGAGAIVVQGLVFLIAGLGDAAKQASGLLGLIPGAIAAVGIAGATVAIGLTGFKDAMKAIGDDEKFNEALKKLSPAAADAARAVKGLAGEWDTLRRVVQENLFHGMAEEIKDLGRIWLPVLQDRFARIAVILNGVAHEFADFMKQASTVEDVNLIFSATEVTLNNLKGLVKPILSILADIFVVSAQVFAEFTGNLNHAAEGFARFIHEARESGAMAQWIRNGIEALKSLIEIIQRVSSIFSTVFHAFDENGDGFLKTVEEMTTKLDIFLQSAQGQEILNTFVDLLRTLSSVTRAVLAAGLSELGPIVRDLLPFLKEMAKTISAVLVTAIKILGPILDAVAKTLSALSPILGPLIGFFLSWAIITGTLSAGMALAVPIITTLIGAIRGIIVVVRLLTAALVANPIIAIITAIALIAWLIWDNWDAIAPKLKAIWDWIARTATSIWNGISDFFVGLWTSIRDFFVGIWNWIADTAKSIWGGISDFFVGLWNGVRDFFVKIWKNITSAVVKQWNAFVDFFRPIFEPLVSIAESIFSIIRDTIIIIVTAIAIVLKAIWDGISAAAVAVWNAIKTALTAVWNALVAAFHFIWDPIANFFTTMWQVMQTATTTVWNNIMAFLSSVWEAILVVFHTLWDPIAEFFAWLWGVITTGITDAWNGIVSFLTGIWNWITNLFHSVWQGIADFFSNIWNSQIVTAVRNGVSSVVDWIGSLPGKIWDLVKNAGSWLIDAGKQVIVGFLNGLKNAFKAVADWVGGIKDWIVSHKGPPEKDRKMLIPAGQAIMLGFLEGLQSKQTMIQRFLDGFTNDVQNGMSNVNSAMTGSAASLNAASTLGIVTSLPSNAEAIASALTPVQVGANGVGGSGADAATATAGITIQNLTLHVAGNLDPTKPVEWRNAMKEIKNGIRSVDRGYPSNG